MRNTRRPLAVLAAVTVGLFAIVSAAPVTGATLPPTLQRDTMQLTDTPGNWFRSEATGSPVTTVALGGRVDFNVGDFTETRHTATLLIKPTTSKLQVDQDSAWRGSGASATFDAPGVYLFVCKVHPYMTGVVAVQDTAGNVPPVTSGALPFLAHLGAASLPAPTVLSVLPMIAPTDAEKRQKWDIQGAADKLVPQVPGIGEVWVDTQFEAVPGQTGEHGDQKPGSITVVDAASSHVEREINGLDPQAQGRWNNPHNMWADAREDTVYNANWFGRWANKIDRATGDVLGSIEVGQAPTHFVTDPNEHSAHFEALSLPLSADNNILSVLDNGVLDNGVLDIIDSKPSGEGRNHPHGQWITSDGAKTVVPNMFKGMGVAGSISILDTETSEVLKEITGPAVQMPVAAGIKGKTKAYVANIASGQVSVIDLASMTLTKNIPVTLTSDCQSGAQFGLTDTLQAPIQTPVSPDGRFVGVAVMSLTTVARPCTGAADHVAIIDTLTDTVVARVGIGRAGHSSGTHGANWQPKLGGGYYLSVANQHSNVMTTVDPDPNSDGSAVDAAVVGRTILGSGASATDGTGGQGIKPLPNAYDGWVQDTVALTGTLNPEVEGWIAQLTSCQRDPSASACS